MGDYAREAMVLSRTIQPLLHGRNPDVVGAALADLCSIYFAGHNPIMRDDLLRFWFETMKAMIPESEKEFFGNAGFPKHVQ
jgi:hypothetical protein